MSKKSTTSFWASPLLWILLLVGGAALLAILLASREDTPVSVALETSTVEISGQALPPFSDPDLGLGQSAPSITATTLEGDRVQVPSAGSPRVIGFFAHWCPHCQAEVPNVVEWLDAADLPGGVDVLAVSTSVNESADNYPPSAWFARTRWPNTVLLDSPEGEIAASYGLTAFPYWVAVDADGTVARRHSGSMDEATFRDLMAAALGS